MLVRVVSNHPVQVYYRLIDKVIIQFDSTTTLLSMISRDDQLYVPSVLPYIIVSMMQISTPSAKQSSLLYNMPSYVPNKRPSYLTLMSCIMVVRVVSDHPVQVYCHIIDKVLIQSDYTTTLPSMIPSDYALYVPSALPSMTSSMVENPCTISKSKFTTI